MLIKLKDYNNITTDKMIDYYYGILHINSDEIWTNLFDFI